MSVALSQRGLLLQDKIGRRIPEFIRDLADALRDPRFIWVPLPSDYLSAVDKSGNEAPITLQTTQPARASRLGDGLAITFNGTTDAMSTPDQNRFSFNVLGLTDLPFSVMAVGNAATSVAERDMLAKWTSGTGPEYIFALGGNALKLTLEDLSTASQPNIASSGGDASVTLNAWKLWTATYSGLGGALAMNGAALYENGRLLTSTVTNSGTYVAMENLTQPLEVGARNTHASALFVGSMAMAALCGVQLSLAEITDVYNICKDFLGLA